MGCNDIDQIHQKDKGDEGSVGLQEYTSYEVTVDDGVSMLIDF